MCIIAIKKANHPLPEAKIMERMFKNNPDGAGFCYCQNGEVIIQKGYMTYEAFKEALKMVSERIDTYSAPMIFHFRISTHGGVNPSLCHPFQMSRNISDLKRLTGSTSLAIVHNGIIPIKTRKDVSDTMEYITRHLYKRYKRDRDFYKNKRQREIIHSEIGSSKLAFLDSRGEIYTIGEFIEDDGILYSNSSYKERDCFLNFCWDDYMDYEKVSPLDEGYIVTESQMFEIEEANYFLGKGGKLYKYDEYLDVCFETKDTAYNINGFPVSYDEDNAIWINVIR